MEIVEEGKEEKEEYAWIREETEFRDKTEFREEMELKRVM